MGLLDGLVQGALGNLLGGQDGDSNQLVEVLMKQVLGGDGEAGLGNLISSFQSNGLGDLVNSWVGQGANMAPSADQIKAGMGGALGNIATQLGMSEDDAAGQLTSMLPGLIDKLTPSGEANNTLDVGDAMDLLKKFL